MFDEDSPAVRPGVSTRCHDAEDVAHSAADVAAEIRRRMPDVGVKKLHKLLYYGQAHHLAGLGRPLFSETVSAWDMGPVVGQLWKAVKDDPPRGQPDRLGEAELNTIGYVLSRYGRLSARELEHLTHGEAPWLRADADRSPGGSVGIALEWIRDYFRAEEANEEDGPIVTADMMRRFIEGAERRLAEPAETDSVERLRARARSHG